MAKRTEYTRAYRQKNRDRLNAYKREWQRTHPDRVAAAQARYWAKRAAAAAEDPAEDPAAEVLA